MKVLHISTSDSNGAGIAAMRIMEAERALGIEAHMLVRDKHTDNSNVFGHYYFKYVDYAINHFLRFFGLDYTFSLNGQKIIHSKLFKEADIIHLHNIHYARLLFPSQLPLNKKYVFTLHDMWGITGFCNYTYDICDNFLTGCGHCPQMKNKIDYGYTKMLIDRTHYQWKLKQKAYKRLNLLFTTPSSWLSNLAKQSLITAGKPVYTIPNCIPQEITVQPKQNLLEENNINILFVGQKLMNNDRKGFSYIVDLSNSLQRRHKIHIVGKNNQSIRELFTNNLCELVIHGSLSYKNLQKLYRSCDLLLLPTMQDNLPNTILESFTFGTPVVAFDTGGVKDLVSSETGYLAKYKSVEDLVAGVEHVRTNIKKLSSNILRGNHRFSEATIANSFKDLYNNC